MRTLTIALLRGHGCICLPLSHLTSPSPSAAAPHIAIITVENKIQYVPSRKNVLRLWGSWFDVAAVLHLVVNSRGMSCQIQVVKIGFISRANDLRFQHYGPTVRKGFGIVYTGRIFARSFSAASVYRPIDFGGVGSILRTRGTSLDLSHFFNCLFHSAVFHVIIVHAASVSSYFVAKRSFWL